MNLQFADDVASTIYKNLATNRRPWEDLKWNTDNLSELPIGLLEALERHILATHQTTRGIIQCYIRTYQEDKTKFTEENVKFDELDYLYWYLFVRCCINSYWQLTQLVVDEVKWLPSIEDPLCPRSTMLSDADSFNAWFIENYVD